MNENLTIEQKILEKKQELETLKEKRESIENSISEKENELKTIKKELKIILFWDISELSLTDIEEKKKDINNFIDNFFENWEEIRNSWIIQDIFKEIDEKSIES